MFHPSIYLSINLSIALAFPMTIKEEVLKLRYLEGAVLKCKPEKFALFLKCLTPQCFDPSAFEVKLNHSIIFNVSKSYSNDKTHLLHL